MPIDIRRVGPGDIALFANIAFDVFDDGITPERLAAHLAKPQNLMLLALDGDLVVGQCMAVVHSHPDKPDDLYVDEVGVSPDWPRRGIARDLMRAMFAWGRERGCAECWLATEPDNVAARALYDRFEGEPAQAVVVYTFDLED